MASQPNVGALHGSLLAALGMAIASGEYPAGRVLTLDGVSAQHGVSRSVVREAVRVLESIGMVESRRRVGLTVQPAGKWNVFDRTDFGPEGEKTREELAAFLEQLDKDATRFEEMRDRALARAPPDLQPSAIPSRTMSVKK